MIEMNVNQVVLLDLEETEASFVLDAWVLTKLSSRSYSVRSWEPNNFEKLELTLQSQLRRFYKGLLFFHGFGKVESVQLELMWHLQVIERWIYGCQIDHALLTSASCSPNSSCSASDPPPNRFSARPCLSLSERVGFLLAIIGSNSSSSKAAKYDSFLVRAGSFAISLAGLFTVSVMVARSKYEYGFRLDIRVLFSYYFL